MAKHEFLIGATPLDEEWNMGGAAAVTVLRDPTYNRYKFPALVRLFSVQESDVETATLRELERKGDVEFNWITPRQARCLAGLLMQAANKAEEISRKE